MLALLRFVVTHIRVVLPFSALLYFAAGCASISPLQGGPKDETPPKVLEEESTPNEQTNASPRRIELVFDEWITLTDVFNQVVVSPPLQYKPEVLLKGRTVIFELDEKEQLIEVSSKLMGVHNFQNIKTAVTLGKYFKVPGAKTKAAIEGFKWITELYPASANAWDSLSEAYEIAGEPALAISASEQCLAKLPDSGYGEGQKNNLEKISKERIGRLKDKR